MDDQRTDRKSGIYSHKKIPIVCMVVLTLFLGCAERAVDNHDGAKKAAEEAWKEQERRHNTSVLKDMERQDKKDAVDRMKKFEEDARNASPGLNSFDDAPKRSNK